MPKRVLASNPPSSAYIHKPSSQLPGPPPRVAVDGNEEWFELDEFGGDSQMNGAFAQTLAHQRELAGLEIAQPTVNQFARPAGCAAGEPAPFDEQRAVAGGRSRLQYTGSVYASADD